MHSLPTVITAAIIAAASVQAVIRPRQPLAGHDTPTATADRTVPMCNGIMSVMIYGGTETDSISITSPHRCTTTVPDQTGPTKLAMLCITDRNSGLVSAYSRRLATDSALFTDAYTRDTVTITRQCFVSRPDKLTAICLKSSVPGALNCTLSLSSPTSGKVKGSNGNQLTLTGHATANDGSPLRFCTILKTVTHGGSTTASPSGIDISCATEAMIYVVCATDRDESSDPYATDASQYIERAADYAWHTVNYTFDEFLNRHVAYSLSHAATRNGAGHCRRP